MAARFGPYELLDELGAGGMGRVYRAHDIRASRVVALKVISEQPDLPAADRMVARKRFQRETGILRSLTNLHIVPINDAGEIDGQLFLDMLLIDGSDLARVIRSRGKLPLIETVEYAEQVCSALTAAHEAGIVHRDIKPSNVFVSRTPDGAPRFIYVIDFGIARSIGVNSDLTGTGGAIGTLLYMPPEQLTGGSLDPRSDIYALACVVFECLTGRPPFNGVSAIAGHLYEQPPLVCGLVPDIPTGVAKVIARALQKDPRLRFSSAAEFASELRSATSAGPHFAPVVARHHVLLGDTGTWDIDTTGYIGARREPEVGGVLCTGEANGRAAALCAAPEGVAATDIISWRPISKPLPWDGPGGRVRAATFTVIDGEAHALVVGDSSLEKIGWRKHALRPHVGCWRLIDNKPHILPAGTFEHVDVVSGLAAANIDGVPTLAIIGGRNRSFHDRGLAGVVVQLDDGRVVSTLRRQDGGGDGKAVRIQEWRERPVVVTNDMNTGSGGTSCAGVHDLLTGRVLYFSAPPNLWASTTHYKADHSLWIIRGRLLRLSSRGDQPAPIELTDVETGGLVGPPPTARCGQHIAVLDHKDGPLVCGLIYNNNALEVHLWNALDGRIIHRFHGPEWRRLGHQPTATEVLL